MDINHSRIDKSKLKSGVWQTLYEADDGDKFEVLVSKLPNKEYDRRVDQLRKPFRGLMRSGGEIPPDKAQEITATAIAEKVLLDWRGLSENGAPIPYSTKKGVELLLDDSFLIPPDLIPFSDLVVMAARNTALFQTENIEEDVKKSKAGVSGKPPMPAS